MTEEGSTYYLTNDQVGSLRIIADASGSVVKRIDYDSFGNIINDTDPSFAVPFGFAGGLHDRDTALVRFGYRDYDPDVGRWTAKDPIAFAGGDTDLYGYCLNDSINWVDADGLQPMGRPAPYGPQIDPGQGGGPAGGVPLPSIDPTGNVSGQYGGLINIINEIMYDPKIGSDLYQKVLPEPDRKDKPCK